MNHERSGPGKVYFSGSSALFLYNAHLASRIDELYSFPAAPNCSLLSDDISQLDTKVDGRYLRS